MTDKPVLEIYVRNTGDKDDLNENYRRGGKLVTAERKMM